MRATLFAVLLSLWALPAGAQSRPAPDTPGFDAEEPAVQDSPTVQRAAASAGALRVLVVTTGVVGGFLVADILSGGALTAPLISTASQALEAGAGLMQSAPPRAAVIPDTPPSLAGALMRFGATR